MRRVALLLACLGAAESAPQLKFVIGMSRHSIKTPSYTWNASLYTNRTFPTFSTAPAEVTTKGRRLAKVMAQYYNRLYYTALDITKCNEVQYYADPVVNRDVETATLFAAAFMASCPAITADPRKTMEYLFSEGATKYPMYEGCVNAPEGVIRGMTSGNRTKGVVEFYRRVMTKISDAVGCCKPEACGADHTGPCTLPDIPLEYAGAYFTTYTGSLLIACKFAQQFQAQMAEGKEVAWGQFKDPVRDTTDVMVTCTDLWEYYKNHWNAATFGSDSGANMLASMEQVVQGKQLSGVLHTPTAKLVMYFGHDVQVTFISRQLKLEWLSPGWQRSESTYSGVLGFELYKDGDDWSVKAFFDTAGPEQMRNETFTKDSNFRVDVFIGACGAVGPYCPYETFRQVWAQTFDIKCMATELVPTIQAMAPSHGSGALTGYRVTVVVLAVLLVGCLAILAVLVFRMSRMRGTATSYDSM